MEITDEDGEYYFIDEEVCVRCGACKSVCPNSAIIYTRIRPREEESLMKTASGGEQ